MTLNWSIYIYNQLIPTTRIPLTALTAVYLVSAQLLVALHAFLNVRRAPTWLHVAFLPFTLLTIIRCHASVYFDSPGLNIYNQLLGVSGTLMLIKSVEYSFVPISRRVPSPSPTWQEDVQHTFSLLADLRGLEHTYGQRCPLPPYPTSRSAFLWHRTKCLIFTFLTFDTLRTFVRLFGPLGTPEGRSIFFPSLPLIPRYIFSTALTGVIGTAIYAYVSTLHTLLSLLFVGLLHAPPSLYPPVFDRPWELTSLTQFWSRRWHQLFRRPFVVCSWPGRALAGDTGALVCAFLASGVMHEAGMRCMGRGGSGWATIGFFLLQGVGCSLEQSFEQLTGKRVAGTGGAIWAWCWLLVTGQGFADAFCTRGTPGGTLYPEWMSAWEIGLNMFGIYTR